MIFRVVLIASAAAAMSLTLASPSEAQVDERLRPFVVDARLPLARFKEDGGMAAAIGVSPDNLPTRGLGFLLGAHWYPLRGSKVSLGVGGELLRARDTRTLDPETEGDPEGPTVETRLFSLAPQVSLNFGRRDGWSYISGGIGSASLTAERVDRPVGEGSRVRAINYGGGARWFTNKHIAVSLDLRFYSVDAQAATLTRPAYPKSQIMVISGGIALR
jgi:hypothetical protein